MRPTPVEHVRTGLACAIDPSPASSGKPWSAGISDGAEAPFGEDRDVDPRHTRKPMLSLRLSGWLLLRAAARQLSGLLFQAPSRSTRESYQAAPQAEACATSISSQTVNIAGTAQRRPSGISAFGFQWPAELWIAIPMGTQDTLGNRRRGFSSQGGSGHGRPRDSDPYR